MKLGMEKYGSGVRWVVEKSTEYRVPSTEKTYPDAEYRVPSTEKNHPGAVVIPFLWAVADPEEKWWLRLRANPKKLGEVSQAPFLLKAEMMGFVLAVPWGDSERYDFLVVGRDGRAVRVQVKGTGRLYRRGYEVQPVRSTRGGKKKRYSKKDIDVLVGHVQPLDVWYLIPIEKVGRAKSLRLYPDIKTKRPRWEEWKEAWGVLGKR